MKTFFIVLMSILIISCEDTTNLKLRLEQVVSEYNQKLVLIKINRQTSIFTDEYKTLKECVNKETDLSADQFIYDEQDIQIKKTIACYEVGIIRLDKILNEQKKR